MKLGEQENRNQKIGKQKIEIGEQNRNMKIEIRTMKLGNRNQKQKIGNQKQKIWVKFDEIDCYLGNLLSQFKSLSQLKFLSQFKLLSKFSLCQKIAKSILFVLASLVLFDCLLFKFDCSDIQLWTPPSSETRRKKTWCNK